MNLVQKVELAIEQAKTPTDKAWAALAVMQAHNRARPLPEQPQEGDHIAGAARFLLDRLVDHEVRMTSDEDSREWYGHVTPAMAGLRSALQEQEKQNG